MVYHIQYGGFHKLRLNYGRFNGKNGFSREYGNALGYGVNVAREFQFGKIFQKTFVEQVQRTQIVDFFLAERNIVNVIDDLFKPRRKRVGYKVVLTEEYVEHGCFLVSALKVVAVHHRQLI